MRWSRKHEKSSESFPARVASPESLNNERSISRRHVDAVADSARPLHIRRNPVHLPSVLTEYWFSHVCQMWSTFDSNVNYKRQIATMYCSSSEVVFNAIQTMSAACLAWKDPQVRQSFPSFESRAGLAIVQRLSRVELSSLAIADGEITDLLFAVLALGTSLHWARPSQYDDTLYNTGRSLMALWGTSSNDVTHLRLAFFQQAMIHWQMLLCASKSNFSHPRLVERRQELRRRHSGSVDADGSLLNSPASLLLSGGLSTSRGSRPNSSCGISSEVIDLFAQVLALCQSARPRQKRSVGTGSPAADETDHDLVIARDLRRELLLLDFNNVVQIDQLCGFPLETGDKSTPLVHHIYAAQSYRLASLLQLRVLSEAFDTEGHKGVDDSDSSNFLNAPDADLGVLSEQLINMIQLIPLHSGLRCTQLVLCISAAAGLKYRPSQKVDISGLRNVILSRLDMFQRNLPVRPVKLTTDLITAMWTKYDLGSQEKAAIHCLDTVDGFQFQTLLC